MSKSHNKGSDNPNSKLTPEQVSEIKMYLAKGYKHTDLGQMFNITRKTITAIASGLRWKHIEAKKSDDD